MTTPERCFETAGKESLSLICKKRFIRIGVFFVNELLIEFISLFQHGIFLGCVEIFHARNEREAPGPP